MSNRDCKDHYGRDHYGRDNYGRNQCTCGKCYPPKYEDNCHKNYPVKKCDKCVDYDLHVEKNLLTVCRIPNNFIPINHGGYNSNNNNNNCGTREFNNNNNNDGWINNNNNNNNGGGCREKIFSQVVLTYEIILANRSDRKIYNVSVFDTLAGITFEEGRRSFPYRSEVEVVKCDGSLVPLSKREIVRENGQLLNVELSCLEPCSVSKIVVRLALGAPLDSFCEVRHVQNTVCVEAFVNGLGKLKPIIAKSLVWETNGDPLILV